jgi:hypothetical protein
MTNAEYRTIIEKLGFTSARAFAPIIGVSVRASQRFAVDGEPIPGPVARLLRLMAKYRIKPQTVKDLD